MIKLGGTFLLKFSHHDVKKFVVTSAIIAPIATISFAFHAEQASAHAPSLSDNAKNTVQATIKPAIHKNNAGLVRKGDRGNAVRVIQSELAAKGYNLGIDGIFGPVTESAVKSFQGDNGLAIDGIVGPHTKKALMNDESSKNAGESDAGTEQHQATTLVYNPNNNDPQTEEIASNKSGIVSTAQSLIGSPYKWGGTTPSGFDCSGFINYVYQKAGIDLPRTTNDIYHTGTAVSSPSPGDVVFFEETYGNYDSGYATHAGIYIGNGKMIHAGSDGVVESDLSISYWQQHLLGYRSY